jgi:nitrile hydratase accessory protein
MQPERPFNAPWEAQAFAMAVQLNERGVFTWTEWAETLGAEIAAAGPADPPKNYWRHWLMALEKILERNYILEHEEYVVRIAEWVEADRRTPHGQPVVLSRAG